MQIDPFFQVPQHCVNTSKGPVELPVLYKEGDYSIALFCTLRKSVEAQLAGTSFVPAMTFGHYAVVGLVMANFTLCSEAPYCMTSLAIPVSRQQGFRPVSPWRELFSKADQRHMGFYLVNCTSSSPHMAAVSREIWGHPKSHSIVSMALNKASLNCRVECAERRQTLLQFKGTGLRFWKVRPISFTMFSILGNQVMRSILDTRAPYNVHIPYGFRLQLGVDHPSTRPFRKLGLDGKRPLAVMSTSYFQGRFNEGVAIEELSAAADTCKFPLSSGTFRV